MTNETNQRKSNIETLQRCMQELYRIESLIDTECQFITYAQIEETLEKIRILIDEVCDNMEEK